MTPSFTDSPGADVLSTAVELGMEGVVAKRRSSTYRPGVRSRDWIKHKNERTQEVVIGGWTDGKGERRATFGALLLGIPLERSPDTLTYVGSVGTGFSERRSKGAARSAHSRVARTSSPVAETLPSSLLRAAHYVRPARVGEVRFGEWTPAGRFRHPVWRGLRTDKSPKEVRRES